MTEFRRDPLGFLTSLSREYGDVVGFRIGTMPLVLLSHPDDIRDVLVTHQRDFIKGRGLQRTRLLLGDGLLTNEGEAHLRQRRLAQPAFHRQRVSAYADTMVARAAAHRDSWRDGETRDTAHDMMELTLEIVSETLFGARVAETEEIGEALTEALELFMYATLPFTEYLDRFEWLPVNRRFRAVRARLDSVIYRFVHERRASGEDRGDLLSMLLLAQDAEGDGGGMTDEQLRDECMTIFLAGHETTANALTWTWYLLSLHPEIERRMHDEVDRALGGRTPAAADLPALPFTRQIVAESMRLYPPAWVLGRHPQRDYPVRGYVIPKGALVFISQWVTQRDSRWFPSPERFDPDRWGPDAATDRPKFAYFPFGGGTRQCIGEGFAWTEAILVLATIAQRWRLRVVPDHPVVPHPQITLRQRNGVRMTVHARSDSRSAVAAD